VLRYQLRRKPSQYVTIDDFVALFPLGGPPTELFRAHLHEKFLKEKVRRYSEADKKLVHYGNPSINSTAEKSSRTHPDDCLAEPAEIREAIPSTGVQRR
jgi:hypothetical protein